MGRILTDLIVAGLVTKLDGQDERLVKMDRAANTLAKELRKNRQLLIPAILTGLNANATTNDAMIVKAEHALRSEWPTIASVHTDQPISLYRTLLLDACQQAGDGANAAVIWYTAADTLSYSPLDHEANAVREMLRNMARRAEETAATNVIVAQSKEATSPPGPSKKDTKTPQAFRVDRESFELEVSAAFGPSNPNNDPLNDANPHWPQNNSAAVWAQFAGPRLQEAISEQLDELAAANEEKIAGLETKTTQQLQAFKDISQQIISTVRDASTGEQQRLDTLWWLESLYSTSLYCSYRELDKELAAVTMAFDVLSLVSGVMPASLPYLLAEGINRLSGASFQDKVTVEKLLTTLGAQRKGLPVDWFKGGKPPTPNTRLSLRDIVVTVLSDSTANVAELLSSAAIAPSAEMSIPEFGRALLRQEHAVRLAATKQ
jgi:hypothetical protein